MPMQRSDANLQINGALEMYLPLYYENIIWPRTPAHKMLILTIL